MAPKIRKRQASNIEEQLRGRINTVVANSLGVESSMQVDCQSTLGDLKGQLRASNLYSPELAFVLLHGDEMLPQSKDIVSLVDAGICEGARFSIVQAATLQALPPNVMYVPSDILDVLTNKLSSDQKNITRDNVFQVLPDGIPACTIMVPIYVSLLECTPQLVKMRWYPIAMQPQFWRWFVKRLLRECGKWDAAKMITNARQTYLRLHQEGQLANLPVSVQAQEWFGTLEQATAGVDEEGRAKDPEKSDFWRDEYEIPSCGETDEQRRSEIEIDID